MSGVRTETAKTIQVVGMLCEGLGVRAIARLAGVEKKTVLNILETAGAHCEQLLNERLQNVPVTDVQIDEVYSFVNCLQQNTEPGDLERGDQYMFLALDRANKLILHWNIGKRDGDTTQAFLEGLKARINGRFQLTSDGFQLYTNGKHSVRSVFGNAVDYGIEIKHYAATNYGPYLSRRENPVKLQWIKRVTQIGSPNRARMTVNHLERMNLSVRLFNRRFTRKTLGYSKIMRNHRCAVALQIAHFNFCRTHSALKIKATEAEKAIERTPAMAAGITDHAWAVEELLGH